MKKLIANGFNFLAHGLPEFKGKTKLLRLYSRMCTSVPVKSKYGISMCLHFEDFTNRSAILGWYGSQISDEIKELKAGDAFLDIGANAGLYSILAAKSVGPDGLVIAFEPQIQMMSRFLNNCIENSVFNIVMLGMGVAASTEKVKFSSFDAEHTGTARIDGESSKNAWMVNVSEDLSAIKKYIGCRDLMIKIDTEGAEIEVLKGLGSVLSLANIKSIIIEIDEENLKKFGASASEVYIFMRDSGFVPTVRECGCSLHYDEIFVKHGRRDVQGSSRLQGP